MQRRDGRPAQDPAAASARAQNGVVGASLGTSVLGLGLLAFVAIASALLLWDGLAARVAAPPGARHETWRARAEIAVGVIGFAAALWVALGLVTHAH